MQPTHLFMSLPLPLPKMKVGLELFCMGETLECPLHASQIYNIPIHLYDKQRHLEIVQVVPTID
jgi:hypothetical protein